MRGYFAAPTASDFASGGKVTKTPLRNQWFLRISFPILLCSVLLFGAAEIRTALPFCTAAADRAKFAAAALAAQMAPLG